MIKHICSIILIIFMCTYSITVVGMAQPAGQPVQKNTLDFPDVIIKLQDFLATYVIAAASADQIAQQALEDMPYRIFSLNKAQIGELLSGTFAQGSIDKVRAHQAEVNAYLAKLSTNIKNLPTVIQSISFYTNALKNDVPANFITAVDNAQRFVINNQKFVSDFSVKLDKIIQDLIVALNSKIKANISNDAVNLLHQLGDVYKQNKDEVVSFIQDLQREYKPQLSELTTLIQQFKAVDYTKNFNMDMIKKDIATLAKLFS